MSAPRTRLDEIVDEELKHVMTIGEHRKACDRIAERAYEHGVSQKWANHDESEPRPRPARSEDHTTDPIRYGVPAAPNACPTCNLPPHGWRHTEEFRPAKATAPPFIHELPEPPPGFKIKRAVPIHEVPAAGTWLWYEEAHLPWQAKGCLEAGSVDDRPVYELTGPPPLPRLLPRFEYTGECLLLYAADGFDGEPYWILRKVEP